MAEEEAIALGLRRPASRFAASSPTIAGKENRTRSPELQLDVLSWSLPSCLPWRPWCSRRHPYDTPEWIVIRAEKVSEKYLSWAEANLTSRLLF